MPSNPTAQLEASLSPLAAFSSLATFWQAAISQSHFSRAAFSQAQSRKNMAA
jgi:hypothetical protein